ncbi:MAG: helix-turn-helix domain-containing protein [Rhodothermales bacterium]
MEEASKLLSTRAGNVSEIAFAVGFQSLSHFSRSFKAQFNMSPSEFASSDE